jgi:hypothetical protein
MTNQQQNRLWMWLFKTAVNRMSLFGDYPVIKELPLGIAARMDPMDVSSGIRAIIRSAMTTGAL